MTQIYNTRNLNTIASLADNTKVKAMQFYNKCIELKAEVLIYEGIRTLETQKKYVADGKSKTLRSYHLVGQAFDFVPVDAKGNAIWSATAYKKSPYKEAIAFAKKIGFTWGGDWGWDSPHMQFEHRGYGTDSFSGKGTSTPTSKSPDITVKAIQKLINSRYDAKLVEDGYTGISTKGAILVALKKELNINYKGLNNGGQITSLDTSFGATLAKIIPPMKLGDKISARIVYLLQASLYINDRTEVGTIDGIWGAKTTTAIKNFERLNGYSPDGIIGGNVWKKLLT